MSTLTAPQRAILNEFEASPEWEKINKPDMLAQVHSLLDRYSLSYSAMARFLLEFDQRLVHAQRLARVDSDGQHAQADCPLEVELAMVRYELYAMAAILTRKERGKPVLL